MAGFETVKGERMEIENSETIYGEVVPNSPGKDKLYGAVADNFDSIVNLATSIVDIEKMKIQSNENIRQMREARENLLAEATSYVKKKDADTRNVVEKMEIIRAMMNDFYLNSGNASMTSEDFCRIITEIVNQMGRIENE